VIKYKINRQEVTKQEFEAREGEGLSFDAACMGTIWCSESKPVISESSGVLPNQVAEERAKLSKRKDLSGVRILDNGAVEFTSPGDRGRMGWIKLRQSVDADGGYRETYNSRT
jgi:hypothetical protein